MKDYQQVISALQNLSSNIGTTALILKKSGLDEANHVEELLGANLMVQEWIEAIKEDINE